MEACIYGLACPLTGDIKYIGQTYGKAIIRYKSHLCCARHDKHLKLPVYAWIRELADKGKKPDLIVLQYCSYDDRFKLEREYIKAYNVDGALLNLRMPCTPFI